MHKVDECVSLKDLKNLTKIYQISLRIILGEAYKVQKKKIDNYGLYASMIKKELAYRI